jgi:hypothetical protein
MPSEPADSAGALASVLRMVKRRLRLVDFLTAVLLLAAVLLLELAVLVAADHVVKGGLTRPWLSAGWWVLAVSAVAMSLLMIVGPLCRRLSDVHVARLLERAHPEYQNDLTAAVELARDARAHPGVLAALQTRAAQDVAGAEVISIIPMRRAARAALGLAGVVAAWLVLAAFSSKSISLSAARIFGAEVSAPTTTRIDSFSPQQDVTVLLGEPVNFQARVRGGAAPVRVALIRLGQNNLAPAATWPAANEGPGLEWIELAPEAGQEKEGVYGRAWDSRAMGLGAAQFGLVAGDARTPLHKLVVLPSPAVMQADLSIRWPDYTGRGITPVSGQRAEALVGSQLIISARANVPAEQPRLVFDTGQTLAMSADAADPMHVTAALPVTADARFSIVLEDPYGHASAAKVTYQVQALEDAPPKITRPSAREDVKVAADGELFLGAEASDDFGLSQVVLETRRALERSEQPLVHFEPPGRTLAPLSEPLAASRLGKAGDRLLCRLVARDFKPPAGQTGATEWFTVVITEPQARNDAAAAAQAAEPAAAAQTAKESQPAAPGEAESPATRPAAAQQDKGGEAAPDANSATTAAGDNTESQNSSNEAPNANHDQKVQELTRELTELARQDERTLRALEAFLAQQTEPKGQRAQTSPSAAAEKLGDANGAAEIQGTSSKPGQASGENPGQGEGQSPTQNPGQGQGEGQAQGAGQGEQSPGQGQAEGRGQAEGEVQNSSPGPGEGQRQGKGQEPGQGPGQKPGEQPEGGGEGSNIGGGGGSQGRGADHALEFGPQDGGQRNWQPGDAPPTAAPSLGALGRIIDEAQQRQRAGNPEDAMLREIGMSAEQFQAFIKPYAERFERLRQYEAQGLDAEKIAARPPSSAPAILHGSGDIHGAAGTVPSEKEDLSRLAAPSRQNVSQEYRQHVEDYLRAVAATQPVK